MSKTKESVFFTPLDDDIDMENNVLRPPANRKYHQNGFTLVELIVVLVIIGILLALVIPSLTGWIDRASTKSAIAECRVAVNAAQTLSIERYTSATAATVTDAEVVAFAKLPGTVSNMKFESATLQHLTYANKYTITYCRDFASCVDHDEMFNLEEAKKYPDWDAKKTDYKRGDTVAKDGVIYVYNNDTSFSKEPGQAKQIWCVAGFVDGKPQSYDFRCWYATGVIVTYGGKKYISTNDSLNGGGIPFDGSKYWTLID